MELTQNQLENIKNKKPIEFCDEDIIFLYKTAQTVAKKWGLVGKDKEDYLQDFVTDFTLEYVYKFDKNKASYSTFVYQYALYSFYYFARKMKQANKIISSVKLDHEIFLNGEFVSSVLDNIPSPTKKVLSPYYIEVLNELCDKKYTSLKEYYLNGKTSVQIGKENKISRQAVNQRVNKEKAILKEELKSLGFDTDNYIEKF